MKKVTFTELSRKDFESHRGTCPLEIGRFSVVRSKVQELIGPLKIYRIWTQNDKIDEINISQVDKDPTEDFHGPISIVLSSDDKLYTVTDEYGESFSITQVNE